MRRIELEIISDFACPWCLIGKRRLQTAMQSCPEIRFAVSWRPFQLNPDMPSAGQNRRAYYRQKFGEEGYGNLRASLQEAGAETNIVFCDEPDARAPNTLAAHVLMDLAMEESAVDADAFAEALFCSHHVACENIGSDEVLLRLASEVDMDPDRARSALVDAVRTEQVRAQIQQARRAAVSGVPFFIINRRQAIAGAQPTETLVAAFTQLASGDE